MGTLGQRRDRITRLGLIGIVLYGIAWIALSHIWIAVNVWNQAYDRSVAPWAIGVCGIVVLLMGAAAVAFVRKPRARNVIVRLAFSFVVIVGAGLFGLSRNVEKGLAASYYLYIEVGPALAALLVAELALPEPGPVDAP